VDLKAAHARALADLEEGTAALQKAHERVSELRIMADALERAMQLYDPPVVVEEGRTEAEVLGAIGTSTISGTANESLRLGDILISDEDPSITNLSFGVLRRLARPASTQEVRETISRVGGKDFNRGKDYSQDQVRSALSWLMKSERVVRVSPGTWMIRKPAQPQDDFTPADESAGVIKDQRERALAKDSALAGADLTSQPTG
jgi:hypothetical protein